jgi:hypothetical protein
VVGGVTLTKDERLQQVVATAAMLVAQNDTSFDETYEPRGWPVKVEEKGKKADPNASKAGWPVATPCFSLVDKTYLALRDLEPTMHSEIEYELISSWRPFREEVDRKREEADAIRLGKKPKKGK